MCMPPHRIQYDMFHFPRPWFCLRAICWGSLLITLASHLHRHVFCSLLLLSSLLTDCMSLGVVSIFLFHIPPLPPIISTLLSRATTFHSCCCRCRQLRGNCYIQGVVRFGVTPDFTLFLHPAHVSEESG